MAFTMRGKGDFGKREFREAKKQRFGVFSTQGREMRHAAAQRPD
jgi:hypothetical protein